MMSFAVNALTCDFFGVLYPAYCSIKALESPCPDDDQQWLTYWVVYGLLNLAEGAVPFIFYLIPFYSYAKLIGILWLMSPFTKGALYLYENHLMPFMRQHEAVFSSVFGTADRIVNSKATGALVKRAQQYSPNVMDRALELVGTGVTTVLFRGDDAGSSYCIAICTQYIGGLNTSRQRPFRLSNCAYKAQAMQSGADQRTIEAMLKQPLGPMATNANSPFSFMQQPPQH